jgi:hypothetical protein
MRILTSAIVVLATVAGAAAAAGAQTGSVMGTVFRDSANHPVGGAIVSFPAINRAVRTNYLGEFRIDGVPPGKQPVAIRFLGFVPFSDSVVVTAGQSLEREFVLREAAVMLDSQRVVEKRELVEPHMAEFEERRKLGIGHFIDTDQLRKVSPGRPLMSYLAVSLPGVKTYRPDSQHRPLEWYLSGGHGPKMFVGGMAVCPLAIYMDGAPFYVPDFTMGPIPDVSQLAPEDFSAIEYYATGATAPPRYNATGGQCGVLLLWHRFRR